MIVKMVRVDLDELLQFNPMSFAEALQERAGVGEIAGFNFEIYGHDGNTIVFKVTGDSAEASTA